MTIQEFAKYIAVKTEGMIARRYGITTVEVSDGGQEPMIHIVNKDFGVDQSVSAQGPYSDFAANAQTEIDTYAQALAFEVEYELFERLDTNKDISKYTDFSRAGEMLYTKLLDMDRSKGILLSGVLGRRVDEFSIMVLYIHDGQTKTFVNEELVKAWNIQPTALFLKASENTGTYDPA